MIPFASDGERVMLATVQVDTSRPDASPNQSRRDVELTCEADRTMFDPRKEDFAAFVRRAS